MELLPEAYINKLPKLYEQAWLGENAVIFIKYHDPHNNNAWYVTEFDGKDTFFGFILGDDTRLGYFRLQELKDYKNELGLGVERDDDFKPATIKELKHLLARHDKA